MWEIFKNLGTDLTLKWEIVKKKKMSNIKADDEYCNLCMKEKLAIASSNNPNELLNICSLKKVWLLVGRV